MLTLRKTTDAPTTNLEINTPEQLTYVDNVVQQPQTVQEIEFEVLGAIDKVQNAIHGTTYCFADRESLELLATMLATDPEGWDLLKALVKKYED
jgi:hypothetical protein